MDIQKELQGNAYPGRGIILGRHRDGEHAVLAYFIMGRSENSRNRVFVADGDGLRTQAFDPQKLTDPSLVIYSPVRVLGDTTIVTNGDQTDTIADYLGRGATFEDALRTRTFEPDPPILTPRISGLLERDGEGVRYRLSILKSADHEGSGAHRFFFEYNEPTAGVGHFIHTYQCDGTPVPSFEGEPKEIDIDGDIGAFTDLLWTSLNEANKVSLFTRFIHIQTGETQSRIVNLNQ